MKENDRVKKKSNTQVIGSTSNLNNINKNNTTSIKKLIEK
jgi:hypothetical protein